MLLGDVIWERIWVVVVIVEAVAVRRRESLVTKNGRLLGEYLKTPDSRFKTRGSNFRVRSYYDEW